MGEQERAQIVAGDAPREAVRRVVASQLRQALAARAVLVDCAGCGRSISLLYLYRCHECGAWFCVGCGAAHWPASARQASPPADRDASGA